jgi:anti-sigma factor RsiW
MSTGDGPRHAGDALSALLDGELSEDEATRVRAHVAACDACTAELVEVRAARGWMRALPPVDLPFGFVERIVRSPRRRRLGAAALGTAAAASVAFLGMLPTREEPVRPAVATLVRTHAITASVDGDSVSGLATAGVPVRFGP